jgi:hypothetical protein
MAKNLEFTGNNIDIVIKQKIKEKKNFFFFFLIFDLFQGCRTNDEII